MMQKVKKSLTKLQLMLSTAIAVLALFYSSWAYADKQMPYEDIAMYRFEDLFTRVVLKQAGIGVIPDIPKLMGSLVVCDSKVSLKNKKDWDLNCLPARAFLYRYIDEPYFEVKIPAAFPIKEAMNAVKTILTSGSLGEYRISDPDGSKTDHVIRAFIGNDPESLKDYLKNAGRFYSNKVRTFPLLEDFFDRKEERSDEVLAIMRKAIRHPKISVDERSGITSLYFPYEQ